MSKSYKIKYISRLMKEEIDTEKKLDIIRNMIKQEQSSCNHLNIILGKDDKYTYKKCLFCEKMVSNDTDYPVIDASSYQEELFGKGLTQTERIARLKTIKNLAIEISDSNPNITDEEIVKILEKKIKE